MTTTPLTPAEAGTLINALGNAERSAEAPLLARLAQWLATAGIDDIRRADWPVRRDEQRFLQLSLSNGMLALQRNDVDRRAMLWVRNGHGGAALWLDGREVGVPRDPDDGSPLTELAGGWISDQVYAIEVAPQNHPLADWTQGFSGLQYGLLIADVCTGRSRLEMPGPAERWKSPKLDEAEGGTWRLYADEDAAAAGRVARVVPAF